MQQSREQNAGLDTAALVSAYCVIPGPGVRDGFTKARYSAEYFTFFKLKPLFSTNLTTSEPKQILETQDAF